MNQQRGMTFIGFVILLAFGLSIVFAGIKIAPAYIEHLSVKKVMESLSKKAEFSMMTKNQIIESFNKSASTNYITVIDGDDLMIDQSAINGKPVVFVEYQVVVPLAFNLSALMDFEASTDD